MENEILEIIKKSLPEKETGIVRTVFEERDKLKEGNKTLRENLERATEELINFRNNEAKVKALEASNSSLQIGLKKREKEITKKENELAATIAKKEVAVFRECFNAVMKVPQVRKEIHKDIPGNSQNGYQNENEYTSETITEE